MNTGLCTLYLSYTRNGSALFQGLELELKPGQGLFISGPNGSGKTSLLLVLAGLIRPTEGKVQWEGRDLHQAKLAYHQSLHYLGHFPGIKSKLTVEENLRYSQTLGAHLLNEERLKAVLQSVNLLSQKDALAQNLSAGQKRRLALARLLAFPKPLWILDEPFTNLDQPCQQWFSEQLELHLERQGLAILASHQPFPLKNKSWFQTLSLPFHVRDYSLHV